MRHTTLLVTALALLSSVSVTVFAAQGPPSRVEHPGGVALVQDRALGWVYRHFPTGVRLYVYDKDLPGESMCNIGCDTVWPPLLVTEKARAIGAWTVILRQDGRKQWAYKGRPAYLRVHDSIDAPSGDGVDGVWHFLEP